MKKQKRLNPYQLLKEEFQRVWRKVEYPRTVVMWSYPKNRLHEGWALQELASRVTAAEQLGYDVILQVNAEGALVVRYREKPPPRPFVLSY